MTPGESTPFCKVDISKVVSARLNSKLSIQAVTSIVAKAPAALKTLRRKQIMQEDWQEEMQGRCFHQKRSWWKRLHARLNFRTKKGLSMTRHVSSQPHTADFRG